MSDFSNHSMLVARKEHRCEYCGEKILKGEKHIKFSGVFEGEFQNWRMHDECNTAWCATEDEYFEPLVNERPSKVTQ